MAVADTYALDKSERLAQPVDRCAHIGVDEHRYNGRLWDGAVPLHVWRQITCRPPLAWSPRPTATVPSMHAALLPIDKQKEARLSLASNAAQKRPAEGVRSCGQYM